MTKKRSSAKPKQKPDRYDWSTEEGYHLLLQKVKTNDTQLSFADLMGGWSSLPDPVVTMQHERVIEEIGELNCRTGIILVVRDVVHSDSGSGSIIVINEDEARIIFPPRPDKKWSRKHLKEIMKIVLTIEDVLGFKTYDPQLGREIDIRADLAEIRANWLSSAAKE